MRTLVAIPVYNESKHVARVLERVRPFAPHVLIVDDGSTDDTPTLALKHDVDLVRHSRNRGYGRSLRDAFRWAIVEKYDWLITMDCDEQHEPASIPDFVEAAETDTHDLISGSRYLAPRDNDDQPPQERRSINAQITKEINQRLGPALGFTMTDAFCGFKAYRVRSLRMLKPTVRGYAFPMQFWVQVAAARLRTRELPVRLIYNDLSRTFGGRLDDACVRLRHYRDVMSRELLRCADRLPPEAVQCLPGCDRDKGCSSS